MGSPARPRFFAALTLASAFAIEFALGCQLAFPVREIDARDASTTDASTPVADASGASDVLDAETGGARGCAARATPATFCEDFDNELHARWGAPSRVKGDVAVATDRFDSPPAALHCEVEPLATGETGRANLSAGPFGETPSTIRFEFAALIDESGADQATIAALQIGADYQVYFKYAEGGLNVLEQVGSAYRGNTPSFNFTRDVWHRFVFDLDFSGTEPRMSLAIDGVDAILPKPPAAGAAPGPATLIAGSPYQGGPDQAWSWWLDDVALTVK